MGESHEAAVCWMVAEGMPREVAEKMCLPLETVDRIERGRKSLIDPKDHACRQA